MYPASKSRRLVTGDVPSTTVMSFGLNNAWFLIVASGAKSTVRERGRWQWFC